MGTAVNIAGHAVAIFSTLVGVVALEILLVAVCKRRANTILNGKRDKQK